MSTEPDQPAENAHEPSRSRTIHDHDVDAVIGDFPSIVWGLSSGGQESSWLLHECVWSYRYGLFGAALLCAHATCEQEIAGRIGHDSYSAPKGWDRWGLGALLKHAEKMDWYSVQTRDLLHEINDYRRGVYHYRDFFAADSLYTRTYEREPFADKHEIKLRMREELRRNALRAVRAAFSVRAED